MKVRAARVILARGMLAAACGGKGVENDSTTDRNVAADAADRRGPIADAAAEPGVCVPNCEQLAPYCGKDDGWWYACGCPAGYECLEPSREPDFCESTQSYGGCIWFVPPPTENRPLRITIFASDFKRLRQDVGML